MRQSIEARAENFIHTTVPLRIIPNEGDKGESPTNVIFAEARFLSEDKPKQNFPSSGTIDFQGDFRRIDQLENSFEGQRGQGVRRYLRAHDPVLDRANFERCQTEEQEGQYKTHLMKIMETTLRERVQTVESRVIFVLDEQGNAYNEKFPKEPVDVMIQRGAEYRKKEGSPDYERDQKGLEGWVQIRQEAARSVTAERSKWFIISEPEQAANTTYTQKFVDAHEKVWDEGRQIWTIILTRFSSGVQFADYESIATRLNQDYFKGEDAQKQEATALYYASHPIRIEASDLRSVHEIFMQEFSVAKGAAAENKFMSWWKECTAIAGQYVDTICAKFFDPEKVKLTFNALLNKFDRVRKGIADRGKEFLHKIADTFKNTWDEINRLGRLPVEAIMAACGMSGGFSLDGVAGSILGFAMGIGARLGLVGSDLHGSLEFQCPKCKRINRRPYGKLIPNCRYKSCRASVKC